MANYLTSVVLEFSEDPISDATPTWIDVTQDCLGIEWFAGIADEADGPGAGGMVCRMRNRDRRWEPDYAAGAFYPNVTTQRRFRLTLNDGTGALIAGVWYITGIHVDYPGGTAYSEVTFTCGDGVEILALDDLPLLDPPSAESYSDVVEFDEPWGYWRLGEPDGTRARANIIRGRHTFKRDGKKVSRKFKRRRGSIYSSREEAGAVSGPAGTYKNTPSLGQPGLVVGDSDTCVLFTASESEWVRIPLADDDDLTGDAVSLEAIVRPTTTVGGGASRMVVAGPLSGGGSPAFWIAHASGDIWQFGMVDTLGNSHSVTGGTVSASTTYHVAGTFDGMTLTLYVDGAAVATGTSDRPLVNTSNNVMSIGATHTPSQHFNGYIDEVAVYEHALTAERVAAHHTAAFDRGYPQQTAGERIQSIATHALWSEAGIETTGFEVQPAMQHGQARLDEISELAHAEGPETMFWFGDQGNPNYLGYDWKGTSTVYNTTQATFGDQGAEIGYENVELTYDNEVFNDVTVSHESGELANVTDPTSISDKGRRANTDYTDVLLMHHPDVVALANQVLAKYKQPELRPATLTVNGAKAIRQILDLEIGHQVRVKRRGEGGTPIDRITNIIGYRMGLTADKHLTCTYSLARGFNAADATWRLGITGYSELGQTTVLA